jgi:alpha,alpha-trehalase
MGAAARSADAWPIAPSLRYGALFAAVQESGLFEDSKTFADAEPRRDPDAILTDYIAAPPAGADALRAFVGENFLLPRAWTADDAVRATLPLQAHIASLWSALERPPVMEVGSAIGVDHRHVVPGGRFRELYYWDSYFTMLGLACDGRQDLVEEMIDLFADLIDRFGHIPNGTRSYYLSRSQPPVFYLMVALSRRGRDAHLLAAMRREHDFWMSGGHVVTLGDGSRLNRFWDDCDGPRDESWAEDVATARASDRADRDVWRDLRAGAESGWDFSSRWLADGRSLETIRTTRIVPACLNALLHGLEMAIADGGDDAMARAAERRRSAIAAHLWNDAGGFFADHLIDEEKVSDQPTAAMIYPLFAGAAAPAAAVRTVSAVRRLLLATGGLRTTLVDSAQQWDAPNGWAPLQWIACSALEDHGEAALARDIGERWIRTTSDEYARSGRMLEKYDVENGGSGGGGEYPTQDGFGWTNGVTRALLEKYGPAV